MFKVRNRANTWPYLMRYYVSSASACADPGIFTKCGGGVEGTGPPDSKKLGQRSFVILLFLLFLVLTFNLFNSFFTERTDPRVLCFFFGKTIIFQGSRGGPIFYGVGGGVQLFSSGGGGGGGGGRPNANFCRNLSKL